MSIKIEGGDWESCKNMVYKLSLDKFNKMKNKRPDVEFDDVLSEAYCIYAQCLTTYRGNRGMKFSTFLYQNLLGRLKDFYNFGQKLIIHYENYNYQDKEGDVKRFEENIVSPDYNLDRFNSELYAEAKEYLSYEGFVTFKYICERKYEAANRHVFPPVNILARKLGYSNQIMESIMYEIKMFWNQIGCKIA